MRARTMIASARGRVLTACLGLLLLGAGEARAQSAEELIPFEELEVELRKELWEVSKRYTVRRKLPEERVSCRSSTFSWLLERLPLASKLARELELGSYKIDALEGGAFRLDDGDGAQADCEVAHRDAGRVVIVARGFVDAPLVPKVHGTGAIIIRHSEVDGGIEVDCRAYFKLRSKALHEVTKAFRKSLGGVIETRFAAFVSCAATLAAELDARPQRVYEALERLGVDSAMKAEFRRRFLKA